MRTISNFLLIVFLAILGYGGAVYYDSYKMPANEPATPEPKTEKLDQKIIPNVTLTDLNGKNIQLHDFKGKVILLNFWASWCAPCLKEFPVFMNILEKYPDQVVLIALSSDIDRADIDTFLKNTAPKLENFNADLNNLVLAHDTQNLTGAVFQTFRLPETLIIAPDLNLKEKLVGANWTQEMLEQHIENLI